MTSATPTRDSQGPGSLVCGVCPSNTRPRGRWPCRSCRGDSAPKGRGHPDLAALYLVAATSPRVAAFLLLPVYAFKLSPSELAAYGIAIAMAQLIGIICDFGGARGHGHHVLELPEEERHSFLKTTMVLSRLMSLVLMIPIGIVLAAFLGIRSSVTDSR